MSSFRNVLPRRAHKERGQLSHRKHLGELEHHKDYVLRAKDYHRKQDTLQKLRVQASQRNPDEFYHRMISEKTQDGRHVIQQKRGKRDKESMERMKLQDATYLMMQKQQDSNQIAKLRNSLIGASLISNNDQKRKHVIFVDDEKDAIQFDAAKHFNTAPELIGNPQNRLKIDQLRNESLIVNKNLSISDASHSLRVIEKQQKRTLQSAADLLDRKRKVDELYNKINQQRLLQTKGKRVKITFEDKFGDVDHSKTIFKWKQERKR